MIVTTNTMIVITIIRIVLTIITSMPTTTNEPDQHYHTIDHHMRTTPMFL